MVRYITIDFETALADGTPSLEMYRPDFLVTSCAFAWETDNGIKTFYTVGEADTYQALLFFANKGCKLICHNFCFEYGVLLYRFPGFEEMLDIDTMRLVQNYDGGGKTVDQYSIQSFSIEDEIKWMNGELEYENGLGLQASASRILDDEFKGHKKKFQSLINERGGKKGDLHLLTPEEMEEYNTLDAIVTLKLYQRLTEVFAKDGFDWRKDHFLYKSTARKVVKAQAKGVKVNRLQAETHVKGCRDSLDKMRTTFYTRFKAEIEEVERRLLEKKVSGYKREDAKLRASLEPPKFNPRSTTQKAILFVDIMGIEPKFFTKTGKPSFSSKFAKQWGEGGELLKKQMTYELEAKQGENLLGLSEYDGRWHLTLKVAQTKTGRLAGGQHE